MNKVKSEEDIVLINNENIEFHEKEMAKTLNDFVSNIVKNLEISWYQFEDNLHNKLFSHSALQVIIMCRNHAGISIIQHFSQGFSSF